MKKKTNTLVVPREIQITAVLAFIFAVVGGSISIVMSIVSQLQSGQDAGPAWSYLLTGSVAPLALLLATYFVLPTMSVANRAFLSVVLCVTAMAVVGTVAYLFGMIYSELFFRSAAGDRAAYTAFGNQQTIVYIILTVLGYVGFLALVLHWRKQKIWS